MLMKQIYSDLGKCNLYTYDEEKETNFLAAAPHMAMNPDEDDNRRRNEFVFAVLDKLPDFKAVYPRCSLLQHNSDDDRFMDDLLFYQNSGIVRFENDKTGEGLSVFYNSFDKHVFIRGNMTADNCEKLDDAFKSYGKGLETFRVTEQLDMGFERKYTYLKPLFSALEKEGIRVIDAKEKRSGFTYDKIRLTMGGRMGICLDEVLDYAPVRGSSEYVKKSRAQVIKDLREKAENMNPLEDVRWVARRLTPRFDAVMKENEMFQQEVKTVQRLKDTLLRVLSRNKSLEGKQTENGNRQKPDTELTL